ncbi:MAG: Fpg/Nei family DNA glycosylase [Thermoleophilia bacterium]|nr:Fpg/Nei family DNA glycosylase [Thermoleophilia bacterium]MDH5225614.1 Fpg/Nei family DNA glycosylase [Actinomycetota bacterium]MDH5314261.1 Fpg/Nei family DNA glycosylase [Actinomycetota bacterium]
MPEGDTIHRAAATLGRALDGEPITRFDTRRRRGVPATPASGERVMSVEARGKHLLMRFEGGLTLHTHMGMTGSWHTYRPDQPWRRSPGAMVALIETAKVHAICFSAPVVELLRDPDVERHAVLSALGPDLCLAEVPLDEVVRRLRAFAQDTEIGVALLDQTAAAGIGNVYRSEVAWAVGVHPFRTLGGIDDALLHRIYGTAHRLLRANLGTHRRTTIPRGLAVYDRAGRACGRCGGSIVTRRQGEQARRVWWCPGCQR